MNFWKEWNIISRNMDLRHKKIWDGECGFKGIGSDFKFFLRPSLNLFKSLSTSI